MLFGTLLTTLTLVANPPATDSSALRTAPGSRFSSDWSPPRLTTEKRAAPTTSPPPSTSRKEETFCVTPQTSAYGVTHRPVRCDAANGRALFPIIRTLNDVSRFESDYVYAHRSHGPHNSIDFPAKEGSPIFASYHGIARTFTNSLCGKGIRLFISALTKNTPDQKKTAGIATYCHLSAILVADNTRVARGALIGRVGKTGNARNSKPHLHYALNIFGRIAARCRLSNGATNPYCVPYDFKLPTTKRTVSFPRALAKR